LISNQSLHQFYDSALKESLGEEVRIQHFSHVSGGDINEAVKLTTTTGPYFLKWNRDLDTSEFFEKEASGLALLSKSNFIVPEVLGYGTYENTPYLLLTFVVQAKPVDSFWTIFGSQLAEMHKIHESAYGYTTDNYIGRLAQLNTWNSNWISFFIENRLEPQLKLAYDNSLLDQSLIKEFQKLYDRLPDLIPSEPASLLHGDLWSGNFMVNNQGLPTLIDPAVYYGHREIELSFTQLFGGFTSQFYQSYQEHYPLSPGFNERVPIYNLYPLLVHVNLFGSSYLGGIMNTLKTFS
jgi:protein-ribulosamine 3-kinase